MATISANAFNDAAARTAGEVITVSSGAVWTVRTDSRVHINAPASNTGAIAGLSITEGEVVWDSTNIRWMPYNSGSGNVPAIGTIISQGGVSGYLLGVWASIISAQTAVGAAMPASGFIKFREVTNGPFSAGALTGIGASATGPDVQGWMECAHDTNVTFTVPRLGKHTARGGKFFLDTTTGVRGQIFQIPTMGSTAMFAPGMFVETDVADTYEFWPTLNGTTAANGWSHLHIGNATGTTDGRQKYLKGVAGGQMVMGETWSFAATYASLAAQTTNYVALAHACTYTWENDVVEVYYASGHLLENGQQTGLDFTSGGATASDGIYTVTVLDPYHFTVPLAGSGASGAVTSRPGLTMSFTAHGLNIGESVYCDFTTGTAVDGTYEIYAVTATGTYLIKYPHVATITSGAASCLHTLVITYNAHGMAQGNTLYCDFTSGGAAAGVYVAKAVATNTININYPHAAAIASSNVTLMRDVGFVCPAGRKTWIPSNILTEVATGARAINTVPNAAIANRPEWTTTSAGALDLEYVYGTSGYFNVSQPYSVRIRECVFFDSSNISEVATALDIEGLYHGMHGAIDATVVYFGYNYAGGSVKKVKGCRGNAPGTNDHAVNIGYCKGVTFEDVEGCIVQYARSSGNSIQVSTSPECTFIRPKVSNTLFNINGSPNVTIKDLDFCERNNGHGLAAASAITTDPNCNNLVVDGITYGLGFTVPNQQPNRLLYTIGCSNVKLRNCGSLNSPLPAPTWARNLTAMTYLYQSGGANNGVKVQKVFAEGLKTAPFATVNSDKNMLYESIRCGNYAWSAKSILGLLHADLNGTIKNNAAPNSVTGQASVYGTHFIDTFLGSTFGRLILLCNEPTVETASVFSSVVGTAKFNSSGGVVIPNVNDQHIWETQYYIKGHTGFLRTELLMSGGTIGNYAIHYQLDNGSGYGAWRNAYYKRSGAAGTSGQYTFTVTDATGVEIGDYCWGTGLSIVDANLRSAKIPRVTNVVGNTITVDRANTGTVSGIIRFNHLPDETLEPSGFKMKIRITCTIANTTAITHLRADTLSSLAAQDNYYPLDTNTLSFTGLPTGCDTVVLTAGTNTVLEQKDSLPGTTYSYVYSGTQTVDVGFIKPGYIPFYLRNLSLSASDSTIPVQLTQDRNYA